MTMKRRRVILRVIPVIAALAGCDAIENGNENNRLTRPETSKPTATRTASATPTSESSERKTPPPEFTQKWILEDDDDWLKRRRLLEYPDSDEAVDWTPEFAQSTEFIHQPSRHELASALDTSDVPPLSGAVLSKWSFPTDFSGTSVDFTAEVSGWFEGWFTACGVNVHGPVNVHTGTFEIASGQRIGRDRYMASGDTDQLKSPLQVTVDGESIEVVRISYEAEGLLLGLVGPEKHICYLAGGGWPSGDSVTLHTVDDEEVEVSSPVSGEQWELEETLVQVMEDINQS